MLSLAIGAKVPGQGMTIRTVHMDFLYGGAFRTGMPEAYERLILDCMIGDQTLFTRADEIEEQWLLVDTIVGLVQLEAASITPLPKLFSGSERHWFQGLAVVGSRPLIVVRTERLLPAQATARPAQSALPVAGLA